MTGRIVGQDKLVNEVDKIFNIFKNSKGAIRPHFILAGPSGVGKTYTIRTIAKEMNINYFEINAAQLTKEGTSGNSLSKALTPLTNAGDNLTVIFVDEFDKLFISGNANSDLAHEITTGVQNEFLKALEDGTTSVYGDYGKYVNVSTNKVLFIFAGAFNGTSDITLEKLRGFGVKTEFLGRVGLVYNAQKLRLDHLFTILESSKLLEDYLNISGDISREDAISDIKNYLSANDGINTIGARLINTLIHRYFITGGVLEQVKLDEREEVNKMSFKGRTTGAF